MKVLFFILFVFNSVAFGQHYFNKSIDLTGGVEAYTNLVIIKPINHSIILGSSLIDKEPILYKFDSIGNPLDTILVNNASSGKVFIPGQYNSLKVESNGNLIIVGQMQYEANIKANAIIFLLDNLGDTIWTKELDFGPGKYSGFSSIEILNDDSYVVAGFSNQFGYNQQMWLVKFNEFGEIIWENNYGSYQDEVALSVGSFLDDGMFLCGYSDDVDGFGENDILVIKTNNLGEYQWEKRFGDVGNDVGMGFLTDDGNIILHGVFNAVDPENAFNSATYGVVMELDSVGQIKWTTKCYNKDTSTAMVYLANESLGSAMEVNDGFIFTGYSQDTISFYAFGWILKTDHSGNILWNRKITHRNKHNYIRDIDVLPNGDLAFVGFLGPDETHSQDGWILRTNCLGFEGPPAIAAEITKDSINNSATIINSSQRFGDGLIDWGDGTQTYFTEHDDTIFTHVYLENGEYVINFKINACNEHDSLNFETKITNVQPPAPPLSNFTIYPNPANQSLTIKYLPTDAPYAVTISMFDMSGRQVYQQSINDFYKETTLDVSILSAGTYLIRFSTTLGDVFIEKLVVYR